MYMISSDSLVSLAKVSIKRTGYQSYNVTIEIYSLTFQSPEYCGSLRNCDFNFPRYNTATYGKRSLRCFGPAVWAKFDDKIIIRSHVILINIIKFAMSFL